MYKGKNVNLARMEINNLIKSFSFPTNLSIGLSMFERLNNALMLIITNKVSR